MRISLASMEGFRRLLGTLAVVSSILVLNPARSMALDLTLKEAVQTAIQNSQAVLAAEQDVKAAQALLQQARSAMMPTVNLQGGASRSSEEGSERNNYGDISLSQTVYAGGAITAGLHQAEANLRKAQHNLQRAREEAASVAWDAFLDALLQREKLRSAEQTRDYYARALDMARKRLEVGLNTKLEVSRMEQNLRDAVGSVVTARGNLERSLVTLSRAMGLDPSTSLSVKGELKPVDLDLEEDRALAEALRNRRDLMALREDLEIQRQGLIIAGASMRPSASLSGSYRLYHDKPGSTKEGEWTASLNLTVPLLDFGKTDAKVSQEAAKLEKARIGLRELEDSIREQVSKGIIALRIARENLSAYRGSLEVSRESLALAEVGYREGVNTQLDLISARRDLTQAEVTYLEAVRSLLGAMKNLAYQRGTILEDLEKMTR
ncbi:TolC family protein [Thermanaerovibrio acidaminovorans]|uniref:TolC family protein n=1 Tax=Thermanaerovibrio acidaminovorans TaxID=81462 RepID=UPI00249253D3|nr:TolC family protein [Thermanaerovibrio acidaminovorans]